MGERRLESPEQLSSIQSKVRYDLLRGRLGAQKAQQRTFEEAPELAWAPIRWTQGKNGGFCAPDVAPWTRVHEDREQNVADEAQDRISVLNFLPPLIEFAVRTRPPLGRDNIPAERSPRRPYLQQDGRRRDFSDMLQSHGRLDRPPRRMAGRHFDTLKLQRAPAGGPVTVRSGYLALQRPLTLSEQK